jgi:hypothetical protein
MTSVSPDARRIWRGVRVPLAILTLIFAMGLLSVLVRGNQTHGALEPASYEPAGSRALAQLLNGRGVKIDTVRTIGEASDVATGATLFVTDPELVRPERLAELRRQAKDVVLVAPRQQTLDKVLPGVSVDSTVTTAVRSPGCTVSAAVAAGDARLGGFRYHTTIPGARICYQVADSGTLVQVSTEDSGTVTVLGTGEPLTNEYLAHDGNAALSMRLLGNNPRLVWYLPSVNDPALDAVKLSQGLAVRGDSAGYRGRADRAVAGAPPRPRGHRAAAGRGAGRRNRRGTGQALPPGWCRRPRGHHPAAGHVRPTAAYARIAGRRRARGDRRFGRAALRLERSPGRRAAVWPAADR